MADEVVLQQGSNAKIRNPGMVILWSFLTLGIYSAVWYYKINREMRDYGRVKGDEELAGSDPTMSVLAVTLGWLIIVPPFVSFWRCTERVQRTQELAGESPVSGWLIGILVVAGLFTGFAWLAVQAIVQDYFNKVWKQFPRVDEPPGVGDEIKSSADQVLDNARSKLS